LMELLWPGLLILQMFCFINGYPNGAPSGACEDMLPRHSGVLPQPSPAPYTILTNARVFQPGKPITVLLLWFCRATVAQQRTVFWVNIRSMDLTRGRYSLVTNQNECKETNVCDTRSLSVFCFSGKTGGLDLAVGASAGMAEGKPLLPLVICFLILNILA
uniref:Reelin domain-containing protein n=1 Tax=Pundamilia nyererei TaxID=303518 RepID=A0A3B4G0X7_9CICH